MNLIDGVLIIIPFSLRFKIYKNIREHFSFVNLDVSYIFFNSSNQDNNVFDLSAVVKEKMTIKMIFILQ